MYLSNKMLAKSFGLATAAMLLVGGSSAFAGLVDKPRSKSITTGGLLQSSPINQTFDFAVIFTVNAEAITVPSKDVASLKLSVLSKGPNGKINNVAHCAEVRTPVGHTGGNLKQSATCVHKLDKKSGLVTYVLQATHSLHHGVSAKMTMDWVLITYP